MVLNDNKEQMKLKAFKILTIAFFATAGSLVSCVADDNSPGLEYMPDMYRSPAVEAYVDYGEVEGVYDTTAQNMVKRKFSYLPPLGTVAYDGENYLAPYNHGAPLNIDKTHGLFEVMEDSAGLTESANDVNPITFTKETEAEGKELYERFCMLCHGEKGDGQGTVVQNSNGKYPTPGPYTSDISGGEIVYRITYGKNAMGSYASQVNPTERWKIAHYVQKLIGQDKDYEEELLFSADKDSDGDGVMDDKDECPRVAGTVAGHGCPESTPEVKAASDMAELSLVFALGSDKIAENSYPGLERLIEMLKSNEALTMIINGHTDNQGDKKGNQKLSLSRAQAVKAYIVSKEVDASRISVVGYGENKPVATNETPEGRLANRRVEFRVF